MLFPYNTDAPIYHLPIVTVGTIVVNVVVFALQFSEIIPEEQLNSYWMLSYGDGLHPVQWLLSSFYDPEPVQLLINLIFLWSFGLVVEGKLGWWKSLIVFLAIAVGEAAIEQVLLLGADSTPGRAVTASPLVYGLLSVCLVWAPRNNISCLLFYRIAPIQIEVSILVFGGLFLGAQVAFVLLIDGLTIGEAALQLIGATLGAIIGVVLLKTKAVDCEGWDLFSVIAGRDTAAPVYNQLQDDKKAREEMFFKRNKGKLPSGSDAKDQSNAPAEPSPMAQQATAQIDVYLQQGNALAAATLYRKVGGAEAGVALDEKQLVAIIQGLLKAQKWNDAVQIMVAYLKLYPEKSAKMRLKLAEVLIHHLRRVETARRVLDKLPAALPEPLASTKLKLLAAAKELEDDAELEIDSHEDW